MIQPTASLKAKFLECYQTSLEETLDGHVFTLTFFSIVNGNGYFFIIDFRIWLFGFISIGIKQRKS